MRIKTDTWELEVIDEPTYTFGSSDNVRTYPFSANASEYSMPSAVHGVLLNGEPLAVFGSSSCSGVHADSAVYHDGEIFLAIGNHIYCFQPKPYSLSWTVQVDQAACFGVHYQAKRNAVISHGELEISRFSSDGRILWSASGADIFSEGFSLLEDCAEAIDFDQKVYRFNYASGAEDV